MQTVTAKQTYAQWFQGMLDSHGFSQRSFARAWKPSDPETARRAVRRYLGGMVPIERTRHEIAEVFGSKESGPATDTDSEVDRRVGRADAAVV